MPTPPPTDEPGDIEVLLRVHTAGVDRGVWHIMAGLPCPIRLAGYGLRGPQDRVRGREVAGRLEAVGNNVTTLKPGKDAYGSAEGSFAEQAVGRADKRLSVSARRAGAQAMRTRRRRGTGDAA